ncbi:hypothetical protein C9374_004137 [Naegleria lovaniensis]|uniref:Prolyl 4-hydroxylase alpha subunit domain-containing protein n=1 Tax=Naegleria lovaniensis TaxID=51637 RepID=A0AA88KP94_NAELO|nr:uncharacterized protein C9374_004137 [Naegleria lovaniensis]KAG2383466.1 hypothetical protein C9374_004137 [Naegleria lovaniensis]
MFKYISSRRNSSLLNKIIRNHFEISHVRWYSNSVKCTELDPGNIWIIDGDLFAPQECQNLIERSEQKGYKEAPVTVAKNSFKMLKNVRNNQRVMFDDLELTNQLFYKYGPNEYFAPHYDGHYQREEYQAQTLDVTSSLDPLVCMEKSFITVLIYLNDVKGQGGETNFLKSKQSGEVLFSVKPKQGRVLMFMHGNLHEAKALESNDQSPLQEYKYVLRTDVMYRKIATHINSQE